MSETRVYHFAQSDRLLGRDRSSLEPCSAFRPILIIALSSRSPLRNIGPNLCLTAQSFRLRNSIELRRARTENSQLLCRRRIDRLRNRLVERRALGFLWSSRVWSRSLPAFSAIPDLARIACALPHAHDAHRDPGTHRGG